MRAWPWASDSAWRRACGSPPAGQSERPWECESGWESASPRMRSDPPSGPAVVSRQDSLRRRARPIRPALRALQRSMFRTGLACRLPRAVPSPRERGRLLRRPVHRRSVGAVLSLVSTHVYAESGSTLPRYCQAQRFASRERPSPSGAVHQPDAPGQHGRGWGDPRRGSPPGGCHVAGDRGPGPDDTPTAPGGVVAQLIHLTGSDSRPSRPLTKAHDEHRTGAWGAQPDRRLG